MKLEEYYTRLEVKKGDRILVDGMNSLLIGLYVAGRAKKEGLNVSTHALVNPQSKIHSDIDAIRHAKKNLDKKETEYMEAGASSTTFSAETMMAHRTKNLFNKSILEVEELDNTLRQLSRASSMTMENNYVLLSFPLKFFRPINIITKKLFGEKKETMSFRQFLLRLGFKIAYYDISGDRLICVCSIRKFAPPKKTQLVTFDEFSYMIQHEILEYIVYTQTDVKYVIQSDDGEYLYFIQAEKTKNQPIACNFFFLDGKGKWSTDKPKIKSRNFSIIVMPNTDNFMKELQQKDVLILSKERAFEVYGEKIEPY
jgi:hypothetical protein